MLGIGGRRAVATGELGGGGLGVAHARHGSRVRWRGSRGGFRWWRVGRCAGEAGWLGRAQAETDWSLAKRIAATRLASHRNSPRGAGVAAREPVRWSGPAPRAG